MLYKKSTSSLFKDHLGSDLKGGSVMGNHLMCLHRWLLYIGVWHQALDDAKHGGLCLCKVELFVLHVVTSIATYITGQALLGEL